MSLLSSLNFVEKCDSRAILVLPFLKRVSPAMLKIAPGNFFLSIVWILKRSNRILIISSGGKSSKSKAPKNHFWSLLQKETKDYRRSSAFFLWGWGWGAFVFSLTEKILKLCWIVVSCLCGSMGGSRVDLSLAPDGSTIMQSMLLSSSSLK
jgi:hypothetical protein